MDRLRSLVRQSSGWLIDLAGGLLLPLITDLAASWLGLALGSTPARLLQVIAVLVGLTVVLWALSVILRPRPEPMILVPRDARPPRCAGLVALVGRGQPEAKRERKRQAAERAIEYHLGDGSEPVLKVCWLIASGGALGSVGHARAIQKAYDSRCTVHICTVGDAWSVQGTYDAVQRIYNEELFKDEVRELGVTPERVIADFTSGTAPMTAGMALACGQVRPMQYTTGRRVDGEVEIESVPLLVQFRPTRRRRKE